ncbi:DUF6789 family protein [uncultured Bradyrhizobium sp.]|jgi:hypothetical protein|uniref:DUF6789 family protein n=1 Tax=uncultured Bradyrhizobium sp. TaxID=199684 RepID=UPI00262C8E94|nr:DUF6789 family protein [uncultured Bradyrhizobium sp.]
MKRTVLPILKLHKLLKPRSNIWKVAVAGLCGSVTHTLLMLLKSKLGILEAFQPYQSLQVALRYWTGEYVHPLLPWLISYVNGSTVAGVSFANLYRHLPGASGLVKGLIAGVLGWLVMDLIFFPLLGLGLFATGLGLGPWPALFSLAMMLAYSVVMGAVYGIVYSRPHKMAEPSDAPRAITTLKVQASATTPRATKLLVRPERIKHAG